MGKVHSVLQNIQKKQTHIGGFREFIEKIPHQSLEIEFRRSGAPGLVETELF